MTDRTDNTTQKTSEEMFKHALETARSMRPGTPAQHPDLSLVGQSPVPKTNWQLEPSAPANAAGADATKAPAKAAGGNATEVLSKGPGADALLPPAKAAGTDLTTGQVRPRQSEVAPAAPVVREPPPVIGQTVGAKPPELAVQAPSRKPLQGPSRPAAVALVESLPKTYGDAHARAAAPAVKTSNEAEIPVARTDSVPWGKHLNDLKRAQQGNISTIFYGDSITEAMTIGEGFHQTFGKDAVNFGVKGDSTQHLLWRMQHGETSLSGSQPDKGVILIGTNNLGKNQSDHDIASGIIRDVDEATTRLPNTKFLVLGILPRGQDPSDPLRAHIAAINQEVQATLAGRHDLAGKVMFKDIGAQMLEPNGTMSGKVWERDWEHPTLGGYDTKHQRWFRESGNNRLFHAIKPLLDKL